MDSARSWAVAAACCWINVFTFAMIRSAAVVYVALLRTFPVTREQASWPVNLSVVCYLVTGPIAGVLARYIPIWKLTVLGCLGGSLAICACFLGQSMLFLDVFLGVIHGTCIGLLALFSVVINQHFVKYRAMASGISNAGFTIGGFIFPPVIQLLTDKYGVRGALLLCGALMLNSVAGALLQRTPPQVQTQPAEQSSSADDDVNDRTCSLEGARKGDVVIAKPDQREGTHEEGPLFNGGDFRRAVVDPDTSARENECSQIVPSTTEGCDEDSAADDDEVVAKSPMLSIDSSSSPKVLIRSPVQLDKLKVNTRRPRSKHLLSFLLLPDFYLITFSLTVILFNMTTYMTVIVDFAVDREIAKWDAVYLIFAYAVPDLLARLGSGLITDRKYLLKSTMMGSHLALWGTALYLMPICRPYACQVVLSALSGWCNGSTLILIAVLFVELVGVDKLGVCFGIGTLVAGLTGLLRPSLIGFYRDSRGDYEGLFALVGGVTVCLALLWLCFYVKERCASYRKKTDSSKSGLKLAASFTAAENNRR